MWHQVPLSLALLLSAPLVARAPAAPGPAQASAAPHSALVVGIDRYADGSPAARAPLSGAANDARRIGELLVERFGFAPDDVTTLIDEQATVERVVRELGRLIDRAGPESEVVFWFSGHGSRVPDASGRASAEEAGLESSLVCYDSRSLGRDGEYDLSDDLLRALLAALVERTERVLVVTDCCHSGAVTRGAPERAARVRNLTTGTRPTAAALFDAFWPAGVARFDDDDPRAARAVRHVHVAACAPSELAHELELEPGEPRGALSWFLCRELERAQPDTTYRRLVDEASAGLARSVLGQHVWYEGTGLDRRLFDGRFAERPPGVAAQVVGEALVIEAGTLSGYEQGVEVDVQAGHGARSVGRARIVRAEAVRSRATWIDGPHASTGPREAGQERGAAADDASDALRAVLASLPGSWTPIPVSAADDELARAIEQSPWARLEAEPAAARYALERDQDGAWLLSGVTPAAWRARGADPAGELDLFLRREVGYAALVAWSERSGTLPVRARFVEPRAEHLADRPGSERWVPARLIPRDGDEAVLDAPGVRDPSERELAVLEIENPNDAPIYVQVFSIPEDRQTSLLWPPDERLDSRLAPGEAQSVRVELFVSAETWPLARAMRDRYLVIATSEPARLGHLAEAARLVRSGDARPPVRGAFGTRAIDVWVD